MSELFDIMLWAAGIMLWAAGAAAAVFVLVSVIGFIRDGIAAKREQRHRNVTWSILFVISMVIVVCAIGGAVLLGILSMLILQGM